MSRPLNRIPERKKTSTTKTWPSQRCISPTKRKNNTPKQNRRRAARTAFMPARRRFLCMNNPDILSGTPRRDPPKVFFVKAIPHNSKCRYGVPIRRARCGRCQAKSADNTGCCKGERHQWRKQRTEAGAAVAECEGLLPPKHDAGTATRHYRAFWQRRCCAAAAEAVLKPSGGNCAVLP